MRSFKERGLHDLFEIGVVLKAIDSAVEIVTGAIFALISASALQSFIFTVTGDELREVPRDLIWKIAAGAFQGFGAYSQAFWAVILLGHGIVKMFLVIGLLKNKLWAFPTSAAVFALFAAYQIYQIASRPSLLLEIITVIDIALVALILHEYKHRLSALRKNA